jgi:alpha-D-xyloside xylohydrolase
MVKAFSFLSILILLLANSNVQSQTQSSRFTKTSDGIIVYTDPMITGDVRAVKLEVVANNIIRVIAAPRKELLLRQSLITVYAKHTKQNWQVLQGKDRITLKTPMLSAVVLLQNGSVSYYDAAGKSLLSEKLSGGRDFVPVVFEGKRSYGISQTFETTPYDAYYGLGQHQDDVYNYKGQQVTLFQNNTEVGVPFLVSNKNYGILWDNYSITQVGDIRPFHPLSAFQLFSKEGQEGWLTASYSNDKTRPEQITVRKAETTIDMPFVNDSKLQLPTEFKPEQGVVNWEGSIASSFAGNHKLRLTYGGYIKVWIDGQLVLDRWRRAWNPAPALLDIALQKDKKTPIRIEWIPEGGESYISVKWQEPAMPQGQNRFSFASEAGQQMDYYFITGKNIDEVIAGYRYLTGKATIVPKWALGFWQSRERYKSQEEILSTVAEFRKRNIPLDNIVLDWFYWRENDWGSQEFDPARFSNPDSMIKVLHEKYHTKLMISVWPKFYEGIKNYEDFMKRGWLYQRNIADRQKDWVGPGYTSTFYDAFNEDARKGFWDLIHKKIYTKGIDAWWMDASEPDILSNVSPERRKQQMTPTALGLAAEYLNAYPLQNAKGIYEGQRSADPNKRVFLLTRSGFAGSQRYGAAIWSGDIGARWHDMKAQIPAGINFSMSGIPYWTMDIGGFVVENRFERPNEKDLEEWRELNTRWYQFGAFAPLFRVHGQFPFREIYNIAPEGHPAYQSMLYYNKLRYRLLPYIYSLAGSTYHNDYTIMRGLVMDFAKDTAVNNIGDQYMFGSSLLISPVYNYQQRNREVYLPKGQGWYDLYTGKWYAGGQKLKADAPYEKMPVYVKEGSIIPFGPALQYTDEKPADTVTLYVYTGRDASFNLYEDSGTTYEYEKGQYTTIPITWTEATGTLTIGDRKGNFPGMLSNRVFRVVRLSKSGAKSLNLDSIGDRELPYKGSKLSVKL